MRFLQPFYPIVVVIDIVDGLNNGVAQTPPMGFISWQRFGAETDCVSFPDTCISEALYIEIAQAMKDRGLVDAGYVYVNIDDNWSERKSNSVADATRFPNGMKFIADSLKNLGMKFGMYTDIGTHTCQGYISLNMDDPNSDESVNQFIDQMFQWGVESLKVDGCNAVIANFSTTYPKLSRMIIARRELLNSARRGAGLPEYPPLMLSCSWPAYEDDGGVNVRDLSLLREHCNLWRNYGDISDAFWSMRSITDWVASLSKQSDSLLVSAAGPGHWNDPDMLLIGNNGLSIEQQKTQFNLWAIMAAPLYISADVRTMSEEALDILKNKKVISINQDQLGRQGWVIDTIPGWIRVWMRPLSIDSLNRTRVAILFENLRQEFYYQDYTLNMDKIGWSDFSNWSAEDCYSDEVVSGSSASFPVRLDENTSKIFLVTDLTGNKGPNYPIFESFETQGKTENLDQSGSAGEANSVGFALISSSSLSITIILITYWCL